MRDFLEKIPDSLRRFVDPSLPKEMRLMAARGLIPIGPRDLTLVLYGLILDRDKEISKEAEASLKSMPEGVMVTVLLNTSTPPELLDYFARNTKSESLIQKIILNRSTSDSTIAHLAETVHNQSLIELIADNQQRILGSASIVEALSKNPSISRSTLDKVIFFFQLYLNKRGEIPVSHPESFEENEWSQHTPEEVRDSSPETERIEEEEEIQLQIGLEGVQESFLDGISFISDLTKEAKEEVSEEKRETLFHKINQMNVAERIKLSIVGNREARTILIRDSHRIVAAAVLKNPRLTDMEAILIAQSKTVDVEVLREIAETRKWVRIYQVKVSLVNNPKTPPPVALNFIRHLRDRELRALINNKNLPGVVVSTARRIVQEKKESEAKGGKH
jgi:hypothetical protein